MTRRQLGFCLVAFGITLALCSSRIVLHNLRINEDSKLFGDYFRKSHESGMAKLFIIGFGIALIIAGIINIIQT